VTSSCPGPIGGPCNKEKAKWGRSLKKKDASWRVHPSSPRPHMPHSHGLILAGTSAADHASRAGPQLHEVKEHTIYRQTVGSGDPYKYIRKGRCTLAVHRWHPCASFSRLTSPEGRGEGGVSQYVAVCRCSVFQIA